MADNIEKNIPNNSSNLNWWEYLIPGYREPRIIEHLIDKYAKPVKLAVNDVVRNEIELPIRRRLGIVSPKSITERNFDNNYLNTLDSINISNLNKKVPDWKIRTENGDTVKILVHGKDYVSNYGGTKTNRGLSYRITNPIGQIETTLGSYTVQATKDNIEVLDDYDWDQKVHLDNASPYGFLRNTMNKLGTPDNAPENEKTKVKIKYNRKHKKK